MVYQIIRVAGYKKGAKGQKGFGGIQIHDQRKKDVSNTNGDINYRENKTTTSLNHGTTNRRHNIRLQGAGNAMN